MELADGRTLAFAEYGDCAGTPVFHCNGSGGSRLEHPVPLGLLQELAVRFIAVDRPGHGRSDPQERRRLLDWPNDLAQLADHLGIREFYIEGWSAGGAYALACAHQLADRVKAVAILSGIGPYERPSPYRGLAPQVKLWMFLARRLSPLVYPFRRLTHRVLIGKAPEEIGAMLSSGKADDERLVAREPSLQLMMGLNIKEGYRQGWYGPAQDDLIINRPWEFCLEDISVRVDVWQGAVDRNVPLFQGTYQHSRLPNSRLRVLEGTAHLFPLVRWREILSELVRP